MIREPASMLIIRFITKQVKELDEVGWLRLAGLLQ